MGSTPYPSIEGTILDDLIALGYVDGDGDVVTNGPEDIYGFDGNDIIDSAGGTDRVWGGNGNDTIYGGGGRDQLFGEDGDDEMHGGSGADRMKGGWGNDLMFGDGGNDIIQGDKGNDTIHGGNGNDKIYGNKGNNELYGEAGNDFISTGDQTSIVDGGSDNDTIEVRMKKGGDHTLTGGTGDDEFKFIQSGTVAISDVTITDFELGTDEFTIEGVSDSTYLSLVGAGAVTSTGGGADTLVTLTTGDTILFEGITEAVFEAHYGL